MQLKTILLATASLTYATAAYGSQRATTRQTETYLESAGCSGFQFKF